METELGIIIRHQGAEDAADAIEKIKENARQAQEDVVEAQRRASERRIAEQEREISAERSAMGSKVRMASAWAAGLKMVDVALGEINKSLRTLQEFGGGGNDPVLKSLGGIADVLERIRKNPIKELLNITSFGALSDMDKELANLALARDRSQKWAEHMAEVRREASAAAREGSWQQFVAGLDTEVVKLKAANDEFERMLDLRARARDADRSIAEAAAAADDATGVAGSGQQAATKAALAQQRLDDALADIAGRVEATAKRADEAEKAFSNAETAYREAAIKKLGAQRVLEQADTMGNYFTPEGRDAFQDAVDRGDEEAARLAEAKAKLDEARQQRDEAEATAQQIADEAAIEAKELRGKYEAELRTAASEAGKSIEEFGQSAMDAIAPLVKAGEANASLAAAVAESSRLLADKVAGQNQTQEWLNAFQLFIAGMQDLPRETMGMVAEGNAQVASLRATVATLSASQQENRRGIEALQAEVSRIR